MLKEESEFNFETETEAAAEDRKRANLIVKAHPRSAHSWARLSHQRWYQAQSHSHLPNLRTNPKRARRLATKLKAGATTLLPSPTLASALHMRLVRIEVMGSLIRAFETYPDDYLRTFTLISRENRVAAGALTGVEPKTLKLKLRSQLNRFGLGDADAPIVAFLHGELDPTSGTYQLHFHGLTTLEGVKLLRKLKGRFGYERTATGSSALRFCRVRDRRRQFSYLLKSYWPEKPILATTVNGEVHYRRPRKGQRIKERFGTQVLLWLDRHSLGDLCFMSGCWSNRSGGPPLMRDLYLSVFRR